MAQATLDYDRIVKDALRSVVRLALIEVAEHGLPGNHHFYIAFQTEFPGVELPDHLKARYPNEMTIVLQHQFWGLEVEAGRFSVTVSFSGVSERIVVPYAAVRSFADPSVSFGLRFEEGETGDQADGIEAAEKAAGVQADPEGDVLPFEPEAGDQDTEASDEKVVTLDRFRKK